MEHATAPHLVTQRVRSVFFTKLLMIGTVYSLSGGLPTAIVIFIIIMYLKYFGRINNTSVCLSD